ncbi:MinD/ParA family ATP-binding protein [Euzebya pacifica]|uniref:MinD/ParA family ATP-binding protein n=1 Tax=Euzebya pacifica TaxID=1608957 RepID=UPI0013DE7E20|nr:AAA family ATPase [Euzebya pacifica]
MEVFNAGVGNRRSGTAPQVLVFASYKGGAGKTSAALLAASALAEAAGKPGEVVLVDANTAQASISTLLDLRNEAVPDIMRLLDPPWDPKKVTRSLTAIPDTNLHVLFAPHNKRDQRIRNITPQLFRRIVNELRNNYRYIIIDTPVAQNVGEPIFDEFVFTDADELVIVTNPEKESQENNLEFAEIACDPVAGGGRAFPMQHLWILLNRARDGVGYDEVNVRDEFRQYNFAGAVPESDAILRAANDARLHLATSPARDALLHALANITGDDSLRPSSAPPAVDGMGRSGGWRGLLAKVGLGG